MLTNNKNLPVSTHDIIYNTKQDIDYFINSLKHIVDNKNYYKEQYTALSNGDYSHKTFKFSSTQYFKLTASIASELSSIISK